MKELNLIIPEFLALSQSTKNLSNKTITAYECDLRDFCNYIKGNELNEKLILAYINELSKVRKLKDTTINRKIIVLKMFFVYLHSRIISKTIPCFIS